jgi:thymidylate kinase
MNKFLGSKLILVEGLTGSGKSIMAHFIARQLQYNGFPASWIHEGEKPHPLLIEIESSIEDYMSEMLNRWAAYVERSASSAEVTVVEACYFNNLIESLLMHNVERTKILQYADELQAIIAPLNPTLVYLVQQDLSEALERNFLNRGLGFKNFVIRLSTDTPLAKQRGWEGYAGMVLFWQEFVGLTDELFQRYPFRKLRLDNSAGNWDECNRQVLESLLIVWIPEQRVSQSEAQELIGVYKVRGSDREFTVEYEAGELTINFFLNVKTRLIRQTERTFLAEGWHFEVTFDKVDGTSGINLLRIGGRDIDYLSLVGTIADKVIS